MERKQVDLKRSSQIRSVGYDKEKQTLQIEFNSGGVYDYFAVPESVYEDFIRSESLGGFVATRIRGMYEYKRLHEETCDETALDNCDLSKCNCWCHRLTKTSREEKPSEEKKASKKGSSKKKVC